MAGVCPPQVAAQRPLELGSAHMASGVRNTGEAVSGSRGAGTMTDVGVHACSTTIRGWPAAGIRQLERARAPGSSSVAGRKGDPVVGVAGRARAGPA
jgi:hypothetical protein